MSYPPRLVLATDHAGYALKEELKKWLIEEKGIDVIDVGTFSDESCDYPEIMRRGCAVVLEEECPGIIFGGSGNGEQMAANKVHGIRAALCYNADIAKLARSHNNANVMSIGARFTSFDELTDMTEVFLTTEFEGGRHERRVNDIE